MEKLLRFLVQNTDKGPVRNLLIHLLEVRTASEFWDCVFLLLLIFVACYLLLFRLRMHLANQTPQKKKKGKKTKREQQQKPAVQSIEPNLFAWLYLFKSQAFCVYREKHPVGGKILFAYNFVTVSVYLLCVVLVVLSFFIDRFRALFLDLFFIHIYTNVLPKFLFDAFMWMHHRISSGD